MVASCWNSGGFDAPSGSGESWLIPTGRLRLEPRRGNWPVQKHRPFSLGRGLAARVQEGRCLTVNNCGHLFGDSRVAAPGSSPGLSWATGLWKPKTDRLHTTVFIDSRVESVDGVALAIDLDIDAPAVELVTNGNA
jgi:hypothetical protein